MWGIKCSHLKAIGQTVQEIINLPVIASAIGNMHAKPQMQHIHLGLWHIPSVCEKKYYKVAKKEVFIELNPKNYKHIYNIKQVVILTN